MKDKINKFLTYNRYRISSAEQFNKTKADILFKLLPFLLHCNYPDLPGYMEVECPYGVLMFKPEKIISKELFRKYFPTSTALNKGTSPPFAETPCIHSLKTIGSIGTVAQTVKSDCDYWLSIRFDEIGQEGFDLLQQKCKKIEQWALRRGVEVYFFLMDIDQTRENSFESKAEEESAGSALKLLLKDELFRTHILVAGKMPTWWLIPPGLSESEYRAYVDKLYESGAVNPNSFIDLGYISDIPKSEIFGACLWQMNKALDSPFKSVIKFAYLELLLTKTEESLTLFSDRIKCLVTFPEKLPADEAKLELAEIDPYLLLAREIVSFYRQEKTDKKRDELIRECLFLKTLEGMESKRKKIGSESKINSTMNLMQKWQLLPDSYEHFTKIRYWRHKDLVTIGAKVHDYLLETYKRLRLIFKKFDQQTLTITERDIAVLGRKLFTFYEKKPDKVEYIRSLSRESMAQNDITIHITRLDGVIYYIAFQGEYNHQNIKEMAHMVIRRDTNLVRLITWMYINGIIHAKTVMHLTKNFMSLSLVDIQDLISAIRSSFPIVHFSKISPSQLIKQERIIKALVVLNMTKEPVRGNKNLYSTLITTNSYGEFFIHDFDTLSKLKGTFMQLLTRHHVCRWKQNLDFFIPTHEEKHLIMTMIEK